MRPPIRRTRCLALLLASLVLVLPGARSARALDEEVRVQAAFLYNFLRFANWPPEANATASITIGILGSDPVEDALGAVRGSELHGRRVEVKRVTAAQAGDCHLLYIARSEGGRTGSILSAVARHPVLTVAGSPGFTRQGGMVEFVIVGDTVKFKVNLDAARRGGLRLGSQMVGVAIEVMEGLP